MIRREWNELEELRREEREEGKYREQRNRYGGTGNEGAEGSRMRVGSGESGHIGDTRDEQLFERMFSIEEFADAMGVAPQTIRNWVAARKVPFVRVGGRTRFRRESIRAWLAKLEKQPCL